MNENPIYIAIDLKSFYASVECLERGLDPLNVNLVVADASRTEKTICLAVSPSLKAIGISGRSRLFEVVQKVKEENAIRKIKAPNHSFTGASYYDIELKNKPELSLDYIVAPPRMAKYIEYSTRIYNIYLKYVASEDIHVYSIDEVFLDVTHYLKAAKLTAKEFATKMLREVFQTIGITATAGIGTNLYLCKIAMDIVAKNIPADESGVRIAELDEMSYRRLLWTHKPLTDFWRVGKGYVKKLEQNGIFTMGDVARCSIGKKNEFYNEDLLYKLFGINAELLIDHAWGWEPCTMADIKSYRPTTNSLSTGQVLSRPYNYEEAGVVVHEMTELLVLDMVDKELVTDQIVLTVGYDIESLKNQENIKKYKDKIMLDRYGRQIPKHAHGTANLKSKSSSTKLILDAVMELYAQIVDENLLVRRINVAANHIVSEKEIEKEEPYEQLTLFTDYNSKKKEQEEENAALLREKKLQQAMLDIKKKHGKNAILKGTNFKKGATTRERNKQIGGHRS